MISPMCITRATEQSFVLEERLVVSFRIMMCCLILTGVIIVSKVHFNNIVFYSSYLVI
jgi:hypothetical protein